MKNESWRPKGTGINSPTWTHMDVIFIVWLTCSHSCDSPFQTKSSKHLWLLIASSNIPRESLHRNTKHFTSFNVNGSNLATTCASKKITPLILANHFASPLITHHQFFPKKISSTKRTCSAVTLASASLKAPCSRLPRRPCDSARRISCAWLTERKHRAVSLSKDSMEQTDTSVKHPKRKKKKRRSRWGWTFFFRSVTAPTCTNYQILCKKRLPEIWDLNKVWSTWCHFHPVYY